MYATLKTERPAACPAGPCIADMKPAKRKDQAAGTSKFRAPTAAGSQLLDLALPPFCVFFFFFALSPESHSCIPKCILGTKIN
jgi:hypothetical protein